MTVLLSQESTSSYFDVGTSSLEMTLPHGHVAGPKVLVGLYLVYLSDLWRIYIYASVPVRNPFDMGPSEGVSLVQRSQISMVLKKVGYTHNKVAILTTQNASQLHLRGVEPKSTGENTRDDGKAGGQIAALLRVDTRSHSRQHLDEPSFTTCEPTCYRITPNSQRSFGHIFCSPICCARSLKS